MRTITRERYDKYVECELILNEMEPLMKRALERLLTLGDRELRIAGLGSMLVGVAILFLVR